MQNLRHTAAVRRLHRRRWSLLGLKEKVLMRRIQLKIRTLRKNSRYLLSKYTVPYWRKMQLKQP